MIFSSSHKIGRSSIKESIDNLPSGVCFARSDGMIILCNHRMDQLYFQLAGNDLQHLTELRRTLKAPQPGIAVLDAEHCLYRFPDQTVWQFSEQQITGENGRVFTQVSAIDVSELYEKQAELHRENDLLREANARAVRLYSELDRIVRDEESFAVKTRVHDDVGLALLKSRNLLKAEASLEELRSMGSEWGRITGTIGASLEEDTLFSSSVAEELSDLRDLMKGIGVLLKVQGDLPRTKATAYLLAAAARECAVNTVRHAEGSQLTVSMSRSSGTITASFTNNGRIPGGPITEGGGLGSLRKRVEAARGSMTVLYSPKYILKITLPDEEVFP